MYLVSFRIDPGEYDEAFHELTRRYRQPRRRRTEWDDAYDVTVTAVLEQYRCGFDDLAAE